MILCQVFKQDDLVKELYALRKNFEEKAEL